MKISLASVFVLYLTGFLAAVLGCWFGTMWIRCREERKSRKIYLCGCCSAEIMESDILIRVHCPVCGATQDSKILKEK